MNRKGQLFYLIGASGAGKDSLIENNGPLATAGERFLEILVAKRAISNVTVNPAMVV